MATIKLTVSDLQGNVIDVVNVELAANETKLAILVLHERTKAPVSTAATVIIPPEVFEGE